MANAIDLTMLAAVKNRAEVKSTTDDNEIAAAITGFSQWLLNRSGKSTLNSVASLDEVYDGNGNSRIFLRSSPILTLGTVTINGVAVPLSPSWNQWGAYVEQSKKSIGLRGGIGNFSTFPYPTSLLSPWARGKGPVFIIGQGNVEIVYTAGYDPVSIVNEIDVITSQTIQLQQAVWVSDDGVKRYPSLTPMTLVASAPDPGEYAVSAGLYTFNVADEGLQVAVSYVGNQAPYDLEYAVRCVVAINYKRKGWQDQESRSTSMQGSSATTRYRNWDWPPEYESVFDYYCRQTFI